MSIAQLKGIWTIKNLGTLSGIDPMTFCLVTQHMSPIHLTLLDLNIVIFGKRHKVVTLHNFCCPLFFGGGGGADIR
jgi:hypothetical protein